MASRRKTGGRRKGTPNKATGEIRDIARSYAPAAIRELARLAKKATSETARVAAANSILDRACGKPSQSHEMTGKNRGPISLIDLTKATDEQIRALEAIFGPLAESGDDDEGNQG